VDTATIEEEKLEQSVEIEEEVLKAQKAPEPGTFTIKQIIHEGDDKFPASVIADSLQSAGYVFVYHTKTGDRSIVNRNMLRTQLEKKLEDGTRAFSVHKPRIRVPYVKRLMCMLHPNSTHRAYLDSMGFADRVCTMPNLKNQAELERHMQKRHKDEWAVIKAQKEREEKEEDRALQRAILKSLAGEIKTKKKE
jgi:hypothetical protein